MSIEVQELVTRIKADASGYTAAIMKAVGSTDVLDKRVQMLHSSMKKISLVTGVAGAAMTFMLGAAVKSFAEFEKKMANAASMWGVGLDQLEGMTKKAYELGTTTVFSAGQVADSYYWMASAGWTAKQSFDAVEATLGLAAATQADLSQTTEMVVENIYAFGLAASDADRVTNVFGETIKSSQATMGRLQESLRFIAPVAAQFGMSIEQTSSLLGVLYNNGIDASMAGTQLRFALYHLIDPTKEAKGALKTLGLTVEEVNPVTNDFIDIVEKLQKAQDGVDSTTFVKSMQQIFGIRAQAAMSILVKQSAEDLRKYQEQVTGTASVAGMLEIQMNSLAGQMTITKNALTVFFEQLGGTAAAMTRGFIEKIQTLVKWFTGLSESTKKAVAQIAAITGVTLIVTAAVTGLIAVMTVLIAKATILNVALAGLPILIGAVVAGLVLLSNATERHNKSLIANIEKQNEFVENTESLISEYNRLIEKEHLNVQQKEKLKSIIEELGKLYPSAIAFVDEESRAIALNTVELNKSFQARLNGIKGSKESLVAAILNLEANRKISKELSKFHEKKNRESLLSGNGERKASVEIINLYNKQEAEIDALYAAYNRLNAVKDEFTSGSGKRDPNIGSRLSEGKLKAEKDRALAEEKAAADEKARIENEIFAKKLAEQRAMFRQFNLDMDIPAGKMPIEYDKSGLSITKDRNFFDPKFAPVGVPTKTIDPTDIHSDEYRKIQRAKREKEAAEEKKTLEERAKNYADFGAAVGMVMAAGLTQGAKGMKEALKSQLITLVDFLEKKWLATRAALIMDAFTIPGVGVAALVAGTAAGVAALEVAKAGISSFAQGGVTGHIPQAANGLVTRGGGGMNAVLHSNEAVMPLEKLAPMLSAAMGKAIANNGGNSSGNVTFAIYPSPGDSTNQNYWDTTFRERVLPAMERYDRLRNKRS